MGREAMALLVAALGEPTCPPWPSPTLAARESTLGPGSGTAAAG
ncbi:hypothetical protein [Nocardioides zeae]